MKNINWYTMILVVMMVLVPTNVFAKSVCDPVAKPNGYCEATGKWNDPSLDTIKKNNCSAFKKNIVKDYCYSVCREDVTTTFPNDVPVLTNDQYDAVLGGNHFRWEEILTTRKRECETVIDWAKWKKDWEKVTGTGNGGSNTASGITYLLQHIFREEHQKNSDINVCALLAESSNNDAYKKKYPIENKGGWNNYDFYKKHKYKTVGQAVKEIKELAGITNESELWSYFGCDDNSEEAEEYTGITPHSADITKGESPKSKCSPDSNEAVVDVKYTERNVFCGGGGTSTSDKCDYFKCVYAKCPNGTKPYYDKNGKKYKCRVVRETACGEGKETRVYNMVNFESFRRGLVNDTKFVTYCGGKGNAPYNSVEFDNKWYDPDIKIKGATKGSSGYSTSLNASLKEIDRLKRAITTCNKSDYGASTGSDTSTITTNYLDQPTGTYKRNVLLIKERIKKNEETSKTPVPGSDAIVYTTKCANLSKATIKKIANATSIKDFESIIGTCKKERDADITTELANTSIKTTVEETFKYTMPDKTNRYVQKEDGKVTDDVKGDIRSQNRYIDIGYPNYPVYYTTPTGTYPMRLTYKNLGLNGHFVKSAVYSCEYKVINRIIPCTGEDCFNPDCTGDKCDRCYDGDDCDKKDDNPNNPGASTTVTIGNGMNVLYRAIALTNPFPGESGKGRSAGINWSAQDIKDYITNNRGVKQNEVYNKTPLYSFTINARAIKKIQAYNKKHDYDDFNLKCNETYGKRCMSTFLKNIKDYGVVVNTSTCYDKGGASFYSCANKPNQDNIRCYVTEDSKTGKVAKDKNGNVIQKCIDCTAKANQNNGICKEGSGK